MQAFHLHYSSTVWRATWYKDVFIRTIAPRRNFRELPPLVNKVVVVMVRR